MSEEERIEIAPEQEAPEDEEIKESDVPEAISNRLITRVTGEPFATKKAAELRQGALNIQGRFTRVVSHEGGFALEVISRAQATQGKKRIPVGTRQRLTAPKRQGYVRRFVNDEGDRIKRFVDAGWSPVTGSTLNIDNPGEPMGIGDPRVGQSSPLGGPVSEVVDREGKKAYLMEIPKEWYDEDMKEKHKKLDEFEDAMRQKPKTEGHYGNIDISTRKGSHEDDRAF